MTVRVTGEMPKYKSHKEVHALKIKDIITKFSAVKETQSVFIVPEDKGYTEFEIDNEYINKHRPEAGGYYVVYKDGYASFSPAKAFEDGYTKI